MTSSATLRNVLVYIATALLPPLADAVYQYLSARMLDGAAIDWRQLGMIAMVSVVGAYIAANRARVGHEQIAAQVDQLEAKGTPKHRQVVVTDTEAAIALAADSTVGEVHP